MAIHTKVPIISFTFDDFPRSALLTGGAILNRYGLAGSYYASLGLMGMQAPTGNMFLAEDLKLLREQGHELGCHTFSHCDASKTATRPFENSILENCRALSSISPGSTFRTFAYPIGWPRIRTKQKIAQYFTCCRGGGQTFNAGIADLNCLSAFFLEKSRDEPEVIRSLIEQTRKAKGWLIFATHDVSDTPTPWGCAPGFFEDIVVASLNSGARIVPVLQAWEALRGASPL